MKHIFLGFFILLTGLVFLGCPETTTDSLSTTDPIAVAFTGLSANGSSNVETTTALTLTFDIDPATLTTEDIYLLGATKGALTGTGTIRTLWITNITVANGANVTVALSNPAGFTIAPDSKTTAVYVVAAPVTVAFTGLSANGSPNTVTTTALTLTFDTDPATLTLDDIAITGATKGTLSGNGTTRTLTVIDILVANGASITVTITNPTGYTITPASRTVKINKEIEILYEVGWNGFFSPTYSSTDVTIFNASTDAVIWTCDIAASLRADLPDLHTMVQSGGYFAGGSAVDFATEGSSWNGVFALNSSGSCANLENCSNIYIAVKGMPSSIAYMEIRLGDSSQSTRLINFLNYSYVVDEDWLVYAVPLADFTGIDPSEILHVGLWCPNIVNSPIEAEREYPATNYPAIAPGTMLISVAFGN